MYQQGGTIKQALDKIASNEYVLPAIQREFVWSPEQICMLFDSVMQGYPFGDFLFWRIDEKHSADYRYYGFVLNYHERTNPHCPELGPLPNKQITAVLDGQQRLTAFNIGLCGSMALKLPRKRWNNPDAFPRRVLALDLLNAGDRYEERSVYSFEFINEARLGRQGKHLWFKVSDILNMEPGPDINDWLLEIDLEKEQNKHAHRTLFRLYEVIHNKATIAYYQEENQDIEHVLSIFIRRNSGGTTLSYSDLLLSIATSQWTDLDARKEIHQLVDDLNQIGPGLSLSKDFVLKAGLMLTDIASVGFQVRNFTQDNMKVLEENWQKIRDALVRTVELITGFGFDSKSIRATSALLPIAYYLYRIDAPTEFSSNEKYADERNSIRQWLIRSVLKVSGIWGSGLDTLLTALRDELKLSNGIHFPVEKMYHLMAQRGKSLEFSEEEIEDLSDMGLSDRRIFALLSMLFDFIDFEHHHFHIDHVFPKSRFTVKRLRDAGVDEQLIEEFIETANRIGNLQLLEGAINTEKRARLPAEWIKSRFPEANKRRHYCDQYLLGEVPCNLKEFLEFYEARRKRLHIRIYELVNRT